MINATVIVTSGLRKGETGFEQQRERGSRALSSSAKYRLQAGFGSAHDGILF